MSFIESLNSFKIYLRSFIQSISMNGYSLVLSLIFFISFMIFFYKKVGSNQITDILSSIVSYGYTRYLSTDEITNIKNKLFTNNPEIFDEITFYINEIAKLYDIYNYKILQGWYKFLYIFFILLIIIITLDINYCIKMRGKKINSFIVFIIIFGIIIGLKIFRINDIKNTDNDFNNLNFKITELKENINNSNTINQLQKNSLYEVLNILKKEYEKELKKNNKESFINYSKSLCYEPPIETDMVKTFMFFTFLFMLIFLIYNSISKIIDSTNHNNLKNNFNSLLSVACILTVIEILYFLVVVMKIIKEKISYQTSNLINLNIKSFRKLKINSILNIFYSKQIFQKNIENKYKTINNKEYAEEIENFQNKDIDNNTINNTKNIIDENINVTNREINKYIDRVNDISKKDQNIYKNKILNNIDNLTNILNKLFKNSAISTEYNLKHENRRVLVIVIFLLLSLLIFFYYNNNSQKDIEIKFNELVINYFKYSRNNIQILIPIFILLTILYYSFNKYNNIKLKQENKVNALELN